MIEEALFAFLKGLLTALFALLPTYTIPQGISLSALAAADFVLPLSELALVFGALVAYAVASLGYAAILRIIKLVRGSG